MQEQNAIDISVGGLSIDVQATPKFIEDVPPLSCSQKSHVPHDLDAFFQKWTISPSVQTLQDVIFARKTGVSRVDYVLPFNNKTRICSL